MTPQFVNAALNTNSAGHPSFGIGNAVRTHASPILDGRGAGRVPLRPMPSAAIERSNIHMVRAEPRAQLAFPRPGARRSTAIKIDGSEACFRVGVHRQVRFGQQPQARDAAGSRKHLPQRPANRTDSDFADEARDNRVQALAGPQEIRIAAVDIDDVLNAESRDGSIIACHGHPAHV